MQRVNQFLSALVVAFQLTVVAAAQDDDGWIVLFDGQTLDGWHINPKKIGHGTGSRWTVEPGGVLAGEQDPPGSGNGGILLTNRQFGNFELSIEAKPDWGVDSGVFLRSNDRGECIQMTVDYHDRGNVGHFYGEGTGGWLARTFSLRGDETNGKLTALEAIDPHHPTDVGLIESCTPQQWLEAWKRDDWNHILIRVEGGKYPKISTSVNDLPVALFDAATASMAQYDREAVFNALGEKGSIALQVHGGNSFPAGKKCRWRNIRIRPLD